MSATSLSIEEKAAPAKSRARTAIRVASIDLLRGLVIIVMALDHVRDYFSPYPFAPEDLSQAFPALFLTRWITHFCAPTFVFLAGASAWLYRRNTGCTRGELQRFLLTRGLWLVLLELTVVNLSWQFNFYEFLGVQVIWTLGWSMVFLSLLLYLPLPAIAAIGAVIVLGHNLLDGIKAESLGQYKLLWAVLHEQLFFRRESGMVVAIAYPLVPWIGVTALGYVFATVLELPAERRRQILTWAGLAMIAAFVVLRLTNLYGEPQAWSPNERGAVYSVLAALNVTKYPPSLLFVLMTLGPALWLLPRLERWHGRLAGAVSVFGRVPLFFYLIHVPVIHAAAMLWSQISFGTRPYLFFRPSDQLPPGYEPDLLRAYVVWIALIVLLYPLCRWYADYKRRHKENRWLSYL
jgi:uncharacterized membrane protein